MLPPRPLRGVVPLLIALGCLGIEPGPPSPRIDAAAFASDAPTPGSATPVAPVEVPESLRSSVMAGVSPGSPDGNNESLIPGDNPQAVPRLGHSAVRGTLAAGSGPPVVTIAVEDPFAAETDPFDIAVFRISRLTGDLRSSLTVFFSTGGGAVPGRDYRLVRESGFRCPTCADAVLSEGAIEIPAGAVSIRVGVRAVPDSDAEGFEPLFVRLMEDPSAGPIPRYVLSAVDVAWMRVGDVKPPPTVFFRRESILRSYPAFSEVTLIADATDPEGEPLSVRFESEYVRHESTLNIDCGSCFPGVAYRHEFVWSHVPPGTHLVSASHLAASGVRVSDVVTLQVDPPSEARPYLLLPTVSPGGPTSVEGEALSPVVYSFEPGGLIEFAEIFANGLKIGVASPYCCPACDCEGPETNRLNRLQLQPPWRPPTNGTYTLIARARTQAGAVIESPPIRWSVTAPVPPTGTPSIELVSPTTPSVVPEGVRIRFQVDVVEPEDRPVEIGLFAGGRRLDDPSDPARQRQVDEARRRVIHVIHLSLAPGDYLVSAGDTLPGSTLVSRRVRIHVSPKTTPGTSLAILEPKDGATYHAPASIPISVQGVAETDSFATATLMVNGIGVGSLTFCCALCPCPHPSPGIAPELRIPVLSEDGQPPAKPFRNWENVPPGDYEFQVESVGEFGAMATSLPVRVRVLPGRAVEIALSVALDSGGRIHLTAMEGSLVPGGLDVELSRDLREWVRLGKFEPGNVAAFFSEVIPAGDVRPRFYRAVVAEP